MCPKCKKLFGRLRHFNSHKCLATGDYGVLSDEDEEEEEDELDATPDYTPKRREIEQAQAEEEQLDSQARSPAAKRVAKKHKATRWVSNCAHGNP